MQKADIKEISTNWDKSQYSIGFETGKICILSGVIWIKCIIGLDSTEFFGVIIVTIKSNLFNRSEYSNDMLIKKLLGEMFRELSPLESYTTFKLPYG